MNKYKLQLSEGFEAVEGKRLEIEETLKQKLIKLYSLYGYNQIKTPVLEYMDVFCDSFQKPELYSLINRHGEILALSSDMTSSIARYISSSDNNTGPIRYSYCADIFRYPKLYQGRNHQFSQVGLELVNSDSINADIEIISLAYKSCVLAGIKDFKIHLSSTKFLSGLFFYLGFKVEEIEKIFIILENKDFVSLEAYLKKLTPLYQNLYDLFINGGDISYLNQLVKKFKNNNELQYLVNLYKSLTSIGIDNLYIDFALSSYAKYYTGIVFQVYVYGISESIIDGGRYDELYHAFYKDYKACGFGFNLSVVSNYLYKNDNDDNRHTIYVLNDEESYIKSYNDSIKLREYGYNVINLFQMNLEDVKKLLENKKNSKIRIYTKNDMKEVNYDNILLS